jgi:hypothetical protein
MYGGIDASFGPCFEATAGEDEDADKEEEEEEEEDDDDDDGDTTTVSPTDDDTDLGGRCSDAMRVKRARNFQASETSALCCCSHTRRFTRRRQLQPNSELESN